MKKFRNLMIMLVVLVVAVAGAVVFFATRNSGSNGDPTASPEGSVYSGVLDLRMVVEEPYAYVDGDRVYIDEHNYNVTPLLLNDRTILPMEFIGSVFNIPVEWNEMEHSLSITYDNTVIVLYLNSNKTVINGQEVILDVAPQRFENKTYLPIRFIGDNLGFEVVWIDTIKQVTLSKSRGDTSGDLAQRKALIEDKLNAIELSRALAKMCATEKSFYEGLLEFADYTTVHIDVLRPYMADYWRGTTFDKINTGTAPWKLQVKKQNGKLTFLVTDSATDKKPTTYFQGEWATIINPFEKAPSPSPSPSPSMEPSPSILPSFHATPLP